MRYILLLTIVCSYHFCAAKNRSYKKARKLASATCAQLTGDKPQTFSYKKTTNTFGHLSAPWKTYETKVAGAFCVTPAGGLYIADSVLRKSKNLPTTTIYTSSVFAVKPYWGNDWAKLTGKDREDFCTKLLFIRPLMY